MEWYTVAGSWGVKGSRQILQASSSKASSTPAPKEEEEDEYAGTKIIGASDIDEESEVKLAISETERERDTVWVDGKQRGGWWRRRDPRERECVCKWSKKRKELKERKRERGRKCRQGNPIQTVPWNWSISSDSFWH
jgi:hypothetical protein